MKKKLMTLFAGGAVTALLMSTAAEAGYPLKKKVGDVDTKLTFFGLVQVGAVGGEGMKIKEAGSAANAETNLAFRSQRIRLGWKYQAGNVRGKVQLDPNKNTNAASDHTNGAAISDFVKDAFISYVVDPGFVVKAGLIKMPNGMSYSMSGWSMEALERGFDANLVLDRSSGVMISGRDMGLGNDGKVTGFETGHEFPWKGFGYDVMVANQASRSAAAGSSAMGGNAYAVRGMFDYTEKFHIEASYAKSENAAGTVPSGTPNKDYNNLNIGLSSSLGELTLRAEYFDAKNIKGVTGSDEVAYTTTAGYFVSEEVELVAKHVQGKATWTDGTPNTSLGNTFLGVNYDLSIPFQGFSRAAKNIKNKHRLAFNYIIASGDTASSSKTWNGLSGYKADAFIMQYQFKF
jgi:hypothetical protein